MGILITQKIQVIKTKKFNGISRTTDGMLYLNIY